MTALIPVQAHKTSDGVIFENVDEATKHQSVLDFEIWYQHRPATGTAYGAIMDSISMMDWLVENRGDVLVFLNTIENA